MDKSDADRVPIRPAATVILLRDGLDGLETLLLRRNSRLEFAGGAWVFPGGRFEESDFTQAGSDNDDAAAPFAAARETEEETGLQVAPGEFVYYAHWTTPPKMPKRYATWFYMTELHGDETVKVDGSEIHDHVWTTPAEGLRRHARQEIEMMPPTFVSLTELMGHANTTSALAHFKDRTAFRYEPRFSKHEGHPVALYAGDAGYESRDGSLPGERHRCVMAEGGWTYERTLGN